MKKCLSVVLTLLMIISLFTIVPFSVEAETTSGTTGGCTWSFDSLTGTLTFSGNGKMDYYPNSDYVPWKSIKNDVATVIIQEGVTTIANFSFSECTNLASISIPNSVTQIGYHTFYSCAKLESITIPSSVLRIGMRAFANCTGLTSITIPDSVIDIEEDPFSGCSKLTSINVEQNNTKYTSYKGDLYDIQKTKLIQYAIGKTNAKFIIPDSVKSIEYGAFEYCDNLKSIIIHDGVTSISEYAFEYCTNINSIIVGKGIKSIGQYAFYECTNLTNISLPNGVESIGWDAFNSCLNLKEIVIPNSVSSIESQTFRKCTSLESVIIGENVKKINSYAFFDCANLTSITIPNSVTSIGDGAFYNCTSLTSITIPNSVTSISNYAFYNCSNLKDIYYYGNESDWGKTSIGSSNSCLTNATFHYMTESTNGIVKGPDNVGEGQSYTTTLDNGETATITIIDSVLTAKVGSTEYTFKMGSITKVADSAVINENDSLLHIITLGGAYYVFDLLTGKQIMTYRNSSTGNYCLSGNSNAYAISAKSFIDNGNFYETNSGATLSKKLMSRDEFDAISSGKEPVYDTTSPSCSISSTNNLASSQTVTLSLNDNLGIAGYYWGTSSSYSSNTYTSTTSTSITKTILSSSTYYLTAKDSAGNVSTTQSITFYSTFLNANGGTLASGTPSTVLTASGYSFTPSLPTRNGFEFVGWNTSSTATTGSKTISPSGNNTYYAIWKDIEAPILLSYSYTFLEENADITMRFTDNDKVVGYYWGESSDYNKNSYYSDTSYYMVQTVTEPGIYYVAPIDKSGNIGDVSCFEIIKVTLNKNYGSLSDSILKSGLVIKNSDIYMIPTRTGFDFVGWNTSSTASTGSKTITPTSNSIYYAIWKDVTAPTVSITNRNLLKETQTVDLDINDNSTLDGYYWGTNSNYSNNTYTKFDDEYYFINLPKTITNAGTYYLTAKDSAGNISDTVSISLVKTTLDANNGTVTPTSVLTESGIKISLPTPVRTNYIFNGWSTSKTASSGVIEITPTSNNTYYAIWSYDDKTKPTCDLSSTSNVASSQTVTLSLNDNVGIAGYYWGTSSSYSSNTYTSTTSTSITKTISSSGTYYLTAKDTSGNVSETKSITFYSTNLNANGGTLASGTPSTVIMEMGKSFSPQTPTRSGYTFVGWSTQSDSSFGNVTITPIGNNTTYYAIWSYNDVTKPSCSISSTSIVANSQTVTLSLNDNVGIAGYYWGTNSSYSSNTYTSTTNTSITKTISSSGTYYLTAKDTSGNISETKSITFYSTTLNANGGTLANGTPSTVLTASGNSFTPTVPTKSGFEFVGWNTDSNAATGSKTITPTGNYTYYAIWKEVPEPTTATPVPTTATPEPVTEVPESTTTAAPESTTVAPESTTVAPEPTTKVIEPTSVVPTEPTENVVVHSKSKQFITAKSYTKSFGNKSFSLKAKTNGNGKLSYKSSNKKVVTVSSKGKIKIKGCGKATITINASATDRFCAATKKITITVKPGKVKLKAKKIYTKNGSYCIKQFFAKQKNCDGYEWQLSPKKSFPINYLRSKYLSKSKKYIFQSAAYKGRKYYIRIRAYKKIGKKTVNGKWSKIIVFKT